MKTPDTVVISTLPKMGTITVTISHRLRIRTWLGKALVKLGAWLLYCDSEFDGGRS